VIFSVACLLVRRLRGCLRVLARREVPKDAGLLVLRHENMVLGRQVSRVRCQPAGRRWLVALSRLIPRRRCGEGFAVTPAALPPGTGGWPRASGMMRAGGVRGGRPRRPRSARW
jgi:putative transposase